MNYDTLQNYLNSTPDVKVVINWYDLYSGHFVRLDPAFQQNILNALKTKENNVSLLGKKLGISRKNLARLFNQGSPFKIGYLVKVLKFLDSPLESVNDKVLEIAGLQPRVPFNLHSEGGAEIRAAFLSDGHVDRNPIKQPQYCALEQELHIRLIALCKKLFGEFESHTYFNKGSHITKFPSVIGDALVLSGVPRGNKIAQNCYLPRDLLGASASIKAAYLRRAFDDEGDVCFDRWGKRAVRVSRCAQVNNCNFVLPSERWVFLGFQSNFQCNLIVGEFLLLKSLGFDCRLYSEGFYKSKTGAITSKWRIQIGQQDELRKFATLINFNLQKKREKLDVILSSYQYRKLPDGKGKEEILQLIKERKLVTFADVGRMLVTSGRSYDLAGHYLRFFVDQGVIQKVKRGVYVYDFH